MATEEVQASPSSSSSDQHNHNNSSNDDANDTLLCLNFNQDGGCLAVGTAQGFRICNTMPFLETFRRNFNNSGSTANNIHDEQSSSSGRGSGGGIGKIEMLFRCNLLALVGGGNTPQYQKNKVLIWDDHIGKPIGELSFRQKVLSVKLRRDRICIALYDRIYIYNFSNLALLDTINTGPNPNGLLCISTDNNAGSTTLACPSVSIGQARVELYGKRKTLFIDAHESELAAMALSVDGHYLATASLKGTIVRLFSTVPVVSQLSETNNSTTPKTTTPPTTSSSSSPPFGVPLREFRRGVEQAIITSLSFSLDKCWLACSSDRGTVHVFKVDDEENTVDSSSSNTHKLAKKKSSSSSSSSSFSSKLAKKILPTSLLSPRKLLLEGENSFVQVRGITHPMTCAFVPDQPRTLAVAGLDDYGNGCLLLASFGSGGRSSSSKVTGSNSSDNDNHAQYDTTSSSSYKKGEMKVQRIAYHRFFKKGKFSRSSKTNNNPQQHDENDVMNENIQLIMTDVEHGNNKGSMTTKTCSSISSSTGKITKGIEEITFGDDNSGVGDDDAEEYGFVSIIADQKVSHSLKEELDAKEELQQQSAVSKENEDKNSNDDVNNTVDLKRQKATSSKNDGKNMDAKISS